MTLRRAFIPLLCLVCVAGALTDRLHLPRRLYEWTAAHHARSRPGKHMSYDATLVGSPAFTAGKFGQGLALNGAQYGISTSPNFTTGDWTEEGFFNTTEDGVVLSVATPDGSAAAYYLVVRNGNLVLAISGAPGETTLGSAVSDGNWHHFVFGSLGGYLLGGLDGTRTYFIQRSYTPVSGASKYLGSYAGQGTGFVGVLDEFRTSNIARFGGPTYSVPTSAYAYDANTVSLYHLDGNGQTDDGGATPAPEITSPATASGTAGQAFTYQIEASNSPTGYGATGLPTGATVNDDAGLISFPATLAAGTLSITISAANAGGTGSETLTVTVTAPVSTAPSTLPAAIRVPIPYNPALPAPQAGLGGGGAGAISDQAANTTTLPPGAYNYQFTAVYAGGEGLAADLGTTTVDGSQRAPSLIVHNADSQSAGGAISAYRVYRASNGGPHAYVFTVQAQPSFATYQFAADSGYPATTTLAPAEALAASIPATGYLAYVRGSVYQGDSSVCVIYPAAATAGSRPVRFATGLALTLTSSDGTTVTGTVPREGGSIRVPMLLAGSKTVTVSSGGAFADPAPFPVTVLPGLRSTADTGHLSIPANPFPTNLANQTSSTTQGLELIGTVQGRRALMFAQGEPVGFVVPYEDTFRQQTAVRADSYEVRDFEGNLVERGAAALNTQNTAQSATVTLTTTLPPGNYRFGLYDSVRRAAGQVDSMGWWSFAVFAPSQSGLPLLGVGGNAHTGNNNTANLQYEQTPGGSQINSQGALNGYTSQQTTDVSLVRRTFTITPAGAGTATFSAGYPARISVNGQIVQQIGLQFFFNGQGDAYTPGVVSYTSGVPLAVEVDTLQVQGAPVADLVCSVPALLSGVGSVSIADYPGDEGPNTTGDHNDVTYRATLGAAGAFMRFPLTAGSAPGDILGTLLQEQSLNIGPRDAARERRRVLLTLPSLGPGTARTGTFSPAGLTTFLQALIAGGVDPHNLAIEYTNEPDIPPFSYPTAQAYATQVFEPFAAATRAASSAITIVGPGCTSILGSGGINWVDAFLTQLSTDNALGDLDGFSFHSYNDVEGNYTNGKFALDSLQTLLTSHGIGNIPLWQTEQGYPDAYNGTATPRFGVRCLGVQLALFDQYHLPCERSFYWYPAGEYIGNTSLYMTTFKGCCVYPNASLLRTWSDELAGKAFASKYAPAAPWDQIVIGNLYAGSAGSTAVLLTDGETSLDVPVTLTGLTNGTLTVVGWAGKTSTVAVAAGAATINLCDLPTFVRLPAGVTLALNLPSAGTNLATAAALSSTYDISNAGLLNDGSTRGTLRVADFGSVATIQGDTSVADVPLDLEFGGSQTFNTVVLSTPLPFQNDNGLLNFDLQAWTGSAWQTFRSVTEEARLYPQYGVVEPISLIDYSTKRSLFVLSFPPQTSSKLRLLIHQASYGQCPTNASQAYTTSGTSALPTLREVSVFRMSGTAAPFITSPATITFIKGTPATAQLLANNYPTGWSAPGLPPSCTLDETGLLIYDGT